MGDIIYGQPFQEIWDLQVDLLFFLKKKFLNFSSGLMKILKMEVSNKHIYARVVILSLPEDQNIKPIIL